MALILNSRGLTLIELLVASGLGAMIIGLSVTPLVQIKRIEKHVEMQSSLDMAHQIALQKARNGTYLKKAFELIPGNAIDQCFGGRGTNCAVYSRGQSSAPVSIDAFTFQDKGSSITVLSDIGVYVSCTATKCGQIQLTVSTHKQEATSTNATSQNTTARRPLVARFSIPASALSSRQEIDFSQCVGQIVTGVDYSTLKAICTQFTGSNTCSGIQTSGPMKTFAQTTNSDPGNCQTPVNFTCADGLATVGLLSGQASCASAGMTCTDPLSASCNPPKPPDPNCVSNWQPDLNTQCLGADILQNDGCGNSRMGKGLDASACAKNSCQYTGDLTWGSCTLKSVSLNVGPGGSATLMNDNKGWIGTYHVDCIANPPPQASQFNVPVASCVPVTCKNLATQATWSSLGLKSARPGVGMDTIGVNGLWECGGALNIQQSSANANRDLNAIEAEPGARGVASNSAPTAVSGSLTLTCHDTGDMTDRNRDGELYAEGVSCVPTTTTTSTTTTSTTTTTTSSTTTTTLAPPSIDLTGLPNCLDSNVPPANSMSQITFGRSGVWESLELRSVGTWEKHSGNLINGAPASDFEVRISNCDVTFTPAGIAAGWPNGCQFSTLGWVNLAQGGLGKDVFVYGAMTDPYTIVCLAEYGYANFGSNPSEACITANVVNFTVEIRQISNPANSASKAMCLRSRIL